MPLTPNELEFLAAWAREEKAPDAYVLPAHFRLYEKPNPSWPWSSEVEMTERLTGIGAAISR
jgi:hypothetical protein